MVQTEPIRRDRSNEEAFKEARESRIQEGNGQGVRQEERYEKDGYEEERQEVKKSAKHPGFKKAQAMIAKKQGIGMERAGAILAAGARKASAKAVKANPRLKKVSGMKKKMGAK